MTTVNRSRFNLGAGGSRPIQNLKPTRPHCRKGIIEGVHLLSSPRDRRSWKCSIAQRDLPVGFSSFRSASLASSVRVYSSTLITTRGDERPLGLDISLSKPLQQAGRSFSCFASRSQYLQERRLRYQWSRTHSLNQEATKRRGAKDSAEPTPNHS